MIKKLTCIECPKGCSLSVDIENCKVVSVTGEKCPKGRKYAMAEVENPVRILTSTVLTEGLPIKMVPVRTDQAIPKAKMAEAMAEVKKIRLKKDLRVNDVITRNFLNLGVNLVSTREVKTRNGK